MAVPTDDLSPDSRHRGWRSRGYLPHFDVAEIPQAISFRLAGSLPAALVQAWELELSALPVVERTVRLRERIESWLDAARHGPQWLAQPEVGALMQSALLHFDAVRYRLHAWCLMPNHVHVLASLVPGHRLEEVIHSWKSYSARRANRILGRTGAFWQQEYFDRFIRSEEHLQAAIQYIEQNPVSAGLCPCPEDWTFGSAAWRRRIEPSA